MSKNADRQNQTEWAGTHLKSHIKGQTGLKVVLDVMQHSHPSKALTTTKAFVPEATMTGWIGQDEASHHSHAASRPFCQTQSWADVLISQSGSSSQQTHLSAQTG